MQESAQMVAWIKASPQTPRNLPFRRLHVSQDRHEIWLIFAEYDEKYLDCLNENYQTTDPPSFLTMHEVSPFDTKSESHMAHLPPVLLALALRSDDDRQTELREREGQARSTQSDPQSAAHPQKGKKKDDRKRN